MQTEYNRDTPAIAKRVMALFPAQLYQGWTALFGVWFTNPGELYMVPKEGVPFYFGHTFEGRQHPHYGRFVRLVPEKLVQLTWMNEEGTAGAETLVTVEFVPAVGGTAVTLTHTGFPTEQLRQRHQEAWPHVLEQQEKKMLAYFAQT